MLAIWLPKLFSNILLLSIVIDVGFSLTLITSILKVDVNDAQRADEIFEELMGDDVEKRKIFIQSNARKVSNLDV